MNLPFDIYAMTNPKTPEDIQMLMDEALAELKTLNDLLDADTIRMDLIQRLKDTP